MRLGSGKAKIGLHVDVSIFSQRRRERRENIDSNFFVDEHINPLRSLRLGER